MAYSDRYQEHRVDVPEGVCGNWRVERFEVTPEAAQPEMLRAAFHGGRGVPAGHYTRLMRGDTVVMSDTPDEVRDHLYPIRLAKGNCLINGLGLGVVVAGILAKPAVKHVTVVEISPEVVFLVGTYYLEKYPNRLTIVLANALEYKPARGQRFNVVWHDIWDALCSDNLPEMHKLHRRYGRIADWQGSWGRDWCEEYAKRGC